MKNYATITIIIILICSCGCRSHSTQLDTSVRTEQTEAKKEIYSESISQKEVHLETQKTWTATQISEEITLVTYDSGSGNVQSVQTTRRRSGRNELVDGTKSGHNVSGIENKDSIDTRSQTKIETDEHQESENDSRPVQKKEWLWIILPIAVIGGIIYLIRNGRKKKHN